MDTIDQQLLKIRACFDLDTLLSTEIDGAYTMSYYSKLSKWYRLLHSKEGAMHFPLYLDEASDHHAALHVPANRIASVIRSKVTQSQRSIKVLELGCGHAYNSLYLSQAFSKQPVEFTAVDFTPNNVKWANAKVKELGIDNLRVVQADFEALTKDFGQFDVVFATESLCHARNVERLFRSIQEVLQQEGQLVVFDGYCTKSAAEQSDKEALASRLLAMGFAVETFAAIEDWIQLGKEQGLSLMQKDDISAAMLPNLQRFQSGSDRLLSYPRSMRFLRSLRLLPELTARHLIAGALAAPLLEAGVIAYYQLVFEKL